jgi:hypothetical protein
MKKLRKKILKRAKAMRRPAKKVAKRGLGKLRTGSMLSLAALMVARKRRRAKRPARHLRNKQGVGPAHMKGVRAAEELGMKHPHKDDGHVAGRKIGSINPA